MLELRPNCALCDCDLPFDTKNARMCSLECTYCADCSERTLENTCPGCGGELVVRPRRPQAKLAKYPASTKRVIDRAGKRAHDLLELYAEGN